MTPPMLCLDTSSIQIGMVVADGAEVLVERTERRDSPTFPGLAEFAREVLGEAGAAPADVGRIAVNVGPGNLGSVRSGVAYANGLAFALGVPVASVDALSLLAAEVAGADPVLCLRNAGGGTAYAGLFVVDGPAVLRCGPLAEVVPALAAGLPSVAVAGSLRSAVPAVLPGTRVVDTGVEVSSVRTLHGLVACGAGAESHTATPLTEAATVFHG